MADETQLLYLEPDDEITTVVRRLREADAPRVVLVVSGRSKATTSAVALRLLAQVAAEENREVALVADAAARALAAEAGIPAFSSVADANAEGAVPLEPPPAQRAPIHVVRGEPEPAAPDLPSVELAAAPVVAPRGLEETQAVPIQRPSHYPVPTVPPSVTRRPRTAAAPSRRATWALAGAALLLLAGGGVALGTVLPGATVTIRPRAVAVGPLSYNVRPEVHTASGEPLTSTQQGEATGHRTRRSAATGQVLFINYSDENVTVPAGTVVSAQKIHFATTETVIVPDSFFGFVGTATAPIVAVEKGPEGNVPADAIDKIEDRDVDRALRGQGPDQRRVRNDDPTTGGEEEELLVVRNSDIDAVTEAIREDLRQQLADQREQSGEDRIYPSKDQPKVDIEVPDDLQGHTSAEPFTFDLTGTLQDDQPYVLRSEAVASATAAIGEDETAVPSGRAIEPDSVEVEIGEASLDGDDVVIQAAVTAQAVPQYDESTIPGRIVGSTREQAEAELSSIGPTTVSLWPFWVDRVPQLDWRVSVEIRPVEPASR